MVIPSYEQACREMFDVIMAGNAIVANYIDDPYPYSILASHLREAAIELRTLSLKLNRAPVQNKN